jgi:hypothetical protein
MLLKVWTVPREMNTIERLILDESAHSIASTGILSCLAHNVRSPSSRPGIV